MIRKWLRKLALGLHRPAIHLRVTPDSRQVAMAIEASRKTLFFVGCLSLVVGLFVLLSMHDVRNWSQATPSVPFDATAWRVLEADSPNDFCSHEARALTACPADPENPLLWTSSTGRFLPNHKQRLHDRRDFWLGLHLTAEQLAQARSQQANQLVLGWVFGAMEVWIDGEFVVDADFKQRQPVVLTLPAHYFAQTGMNIAIKVHPDSDLGLPDHLAQPWQEGFATQKQVEGFKGASEFWRRTRPLALFLLNTLFAVFFFVLWRVHQHKQEYFYFSIYGLICALVQIRMMDIFQGALTTKEIWPLDTFLCWAEGGFGLLVALSFARSRSEVFKWGVPVILLAPFPLYFLLQQFGLEISYYSFIRTRGVSAAYSLGALACLLQAYHLMFEKRSLNLRPRTIRLVVFAVGMVSLAVLFPLQWREGVNILELMVSSRFSHFAIILLMSVTALKEYNDDRKLLERAPLSRYHHRPELPEKVVGAVLSIDIKNSEWLLRAEGGQNETGQLVALCLSQMWSAVTRLQGVVLETAGDGLIAFFDEQENEAPVVAALHAADLIRENLDSLTRQFHDRGIFSDHTFTIEFRAGIAVGALQPIWRTIDGTKVAGWLEAGQSHPFLDSARVMDIERQVTLAQNKSCVLLTHNIVRSEAIRLVGKWAFRGQRFEGKHARIFTVDCYLPATSLDQSLDLSVA